MSSRRRFEAGTSAGTPAVEPDVPPFVDPPPVVSQATLPSAYEHARICPCCGAGGDTLVNGYLELCADCMKLRADLLAAARSTLDLAAATATSTSAGATTAATQLHAAATAALAAVAIGRPV